MRGLYWMTCLRVLDKLLECHPMSKDKEVKGRILFIHPIQRFVVVESKVSRMNDVLGIVFLGH